MSILDFMEKITEHQNDEFLRYFYRGYALGWYDKWIKNEGSERIYNRICATPGSLLIDENKTEFMVDREKIEAKNSIIVCPIGGRVQTYNRGATWDISIVASGRIYYEETPEIEREFGILESIRKVLSFIDLNK